MKFGAKHRSKWCQRGKSAEDHGWCANRSRDESHCKCPCHRARTLLARERMFTDLASEAYAERVKITKALDKERP